MRSLWLALGLALGCGHPPAPASGGNVAPPPRPPGPAPVDAPAPGPLDQDLDRLAARSVEMLADLAKTVAEPAADCAAASTRLTALARHYSDVIDANVKVLHEGREMQLKLALRRHDDAFRGAAKAIADSKLVATCADDAAFTAALDRFSGRFDGR